MSYWNQVRKENNKTVRTENDAISNASTLNAVLDLFSQIGALRTREDDEVRRKFMEAFNTDPLLTTKCAFYARDVRQGLGERKTFRTILVWLAKNHPYVLRKNLGHIPEYGRWDDLFVLRNTPLENDMVYVIRHQLGVDNGSETPSLLGKWMPSCNTSSKAKREMAKFFMKQLNMREKGYRKLLSNLRNKIRIVESMMCRQKWGEIPYDKIPSRASMIYRKAFGRHDSTRYTEYLEAVKKGEKKINVKNLYPYELLQRASVSDETVEVMWKNLPDYTGKGESAIVVADVSGSMTSGYRTSVVPLMVSVSLAIYFAERNKGIFQNKFITFTNTPKLFEIQGKSLSDKYLSVIGDRPAENTNLFAVFKLLVDTAVKYKANVEDMPQKIYIISDMEFDSAMGGTNTNFEEIDRLYQTTKYARPQLVFWNVCSRHDQQPVTVDDKGTFLVSGLTPKIFEAVMKSQSVGPMELMLDILNAERYAKITV